MKKTLIMVVILSMTVLFIGCSNVTEAYTEYVGKAKIEILDENYDEALRYITLAIDENTGDKVAEELKEQIEMDRNLGEWVLVAQDADITEEVEKSISEVIEEGEKFLKRKFDSNLMGESIDAKIKELESVLDNNRLMKEENEVANDLASEIYKDLEKKKFSDAEEKANELADSLKLLSSYGAEWNEDLSMLVEGTKKFYNGINKVDEIKEKDKNFFEQALDTVKEMAKEDDSGKLFVELAQESFGSAYEYYAIFEKSSESYVYYYVYIDGDNTNYSFPSDPVSLSELVSYIGIDYGL